MSSQLISPLNVVSRANQMNDATLRQMFVDVQVQLDMLFRYLRNLTSRQIGVTPSIQINGAVLQAASILEDKLAFGLITGLQIQPLAAVGWSASVTGSTTFLNLSGVSGLLLGLGLYIDTAVTGGNDAFVSVQFQTDGMAPATLGVITDTAGPGLPSWELAMLSMAVNYNGAGNAIGDHISLPTGVGFSHSLALSVLTGSTVANFTAGHGEIWALYATKPN